MYNIFINRMVRAAQQDARLDEEVETGQLATAQAGAVVLPQSRIDPLNNIL